MRLVRASQMFEGSVKEAEWLWYDTARWPRWVADLDRVNGGAKVAVTLSLSYELKRRSPLMTLVDLLFIRRAMTRSLEQTLSRFGAELETARRRGVG